MPEDNTIAELHGAIQVAMGWEDQHLHAFEIRGERYGLRFSDGVCFRTRAECVRLSDFGFRERERFVYVYDFHNQWRLDVRVERTGINASSPYCVAGRGACPPENSGGIERFMVALDDHSLFDLMIALEKLCEDERLSDEDVGESAQEKLEEWRPWLDRRFDRRAINAALEIDGGDRNESEASAGH